MKPDAIEASVTFRRVRRTCQPRALSTTPIITSAQTEAVGRLWKCLYRVRSRERADRAADNRVFEVLNNHIARARNQHDKSNMAAARLRRWHERRIHQQ